MISHFSLSLSLSFVTSLFPFRPTVPEVGRMENENGDDNDDGSEKLQLSPPLSLSLHGAPSEKPATSNPSFPLLSLQKGMAKLWVGRKALKEISLFSGSFFMSICQPFCTVLATEYFIVKSCSFPSPPKYRGKYGQLCYLLPPNYDVDPIQTPLLSPPF